MSPNEQKVLEDALQLDEHGRAELAGALLESLEPAADADAGEAWRVEILRRIAEVDTGAVKTVSKDEFFEGLGE